MKTMKLIGIACLAATAAASSSANSATTNSSVKSATITVLKNCQFSTNLNDLAFGSVTPQLGDSGTVGATAGAAVRCTKNTGFNVTLTKAATMAGTAVGNTDTIAYAATITAGAAGTGSGMTAGSATTVTVTGSVNKLDYDVTPDNYADATLQLTISY